MDVFLEQSFGISSGRITRYRNQLAVSHSSCHSHLSGRFPNDLSEMQYWSEWCLCLPCCVIIINFLVVPPRHDLTAAQAFWSELTVIAQPLGRTLVVEVLTLTLSPQSWIVNKFITACKVVSPFLCRTR